MRVIRSFVIAFTTYSRVPMPQVEWSEENRKYAMCFFPLIGAVIGAALWLWLLLCDRLALGPLLRGAVGAVIPLLVTGGIHMDGFMDTSDALASWQPKEKRLEILKDSRVGAFAAMGCCAYLLLDAALLSEAAPGQALPLGLCFVLSRALSAWALAAFKGARPDGMLDSFARAARRRLVTISSGAWAALCLAGWALTGGVWLALLCGAAAILWTLYYRHMAYKQFGGVTGDLAGWFSQTAELLLTAAVIIGGKII